MLFVQLVYIRQANRLAMKQVYTFLPSQPASGR